MTTPAIDHFSQLTLEWLKRHQLLGLVEQLYDPVWTHNERAPDSATLWRAFLKSVLSPEINDLWRRFPAMLNTLSDRLISLSRFNSTKPRLLEHLHQSLLRFLPVEEKNTLVQKIQGFQEQMEQWTEGSWHQEIMADRLQALKSLRRRIGFDDAWHTAEFLAYSGYYFPYSRNAGLVWRKWADGIDSLPAYEYWWQLLNGRYETPKAIFQWDRIFEAVWGTGNYPGLPSLCRRSEDCSFCPLAENCLWMRRQDQATSRVESDLRTAEHERLTPASLIAYLTPNLWQATPMGQQLAVAYCEDRLKDYIEFPPGSGEEKLLLFLKGVKVLSQLGTHQETDIPSFSYHHSRDIYDQFKAELSSARQESFYALILNNKHHLISRKHISKGTLNQSLVHPREVFAPAIQLRAAAVILVHNHPSGDPHPSVQDIEITKRLQDSGQLIGIKVIDHVIIGKARYFSFVDEGILF